MNRPTGPLIRKAQRQVMLYTLALVAVEPRRAPCPEDLQVGAAEGQRLAIADHEHMAERTPARHDGTVAGPILLGPQRVRAC